MIRSLLLLLLLLAPGAQADDRLDQLARAGRIQEDAPVKACSEITINAPADRVWALLTDVNRWSQWQRDIKSAKISGPLQPGTSFVWRSGTEIHSRIALVQPTSEFVWTGTAFKARAIHVWQLQPLPGGRTLVHTAESVDGFLVTVFYSSKQLNESHQQWLNSLKAAAERSS